MDCRSSSIKVAITIRENYISLRVLHVSTRLIKYSVEADHYSEFPSTTYFEPPTAATLAGTSMSVDVMPVLLGGLALSA